MVSGQQVSFDKSLIYFGVNVESNVRETITNLLGVRVASNPDKHLGLPMMFGQKKTWAFANFVDRFRKRIYGWSLRYLSMGGKERGYFGVLAMVFVLIYGMILGYLVQGITDYQFRKLSLLWTTVNQLIKAETNTWNKDLVCSIIDDDQATRIFSIPISGARSEDMLVLK
ncbi:hypothetical protein J1N35_026327 [Gossypium stocksii]|uniref:Uncharacterized protein n=1 Tax=Gossypium stocksii TaxID=47602 RepID=A0A9D3ZYP4_9ROSI|nr:hypothetical protein J1N35_026327 [Gossypium stocksii]